MTLFYLIILLIAFYLLARVTDEYFVESLEDISKQLKLSPEAAGATLMAVGSSAPELFISFIALFTASNTGANLGAGTIVGSALFNILVIIGVSAMVKTAYLTWQPVLRDSLFYSLSIVWLLFSFADGKVTLFETIGFVLLYIVYIVAVLYWKKLFPYRAIDPIPVVEKELDKQTHHNKFQALTKPLDSLLCVAFGFSQNIWAIFGVSIGTIALLSWVLVESAVGLAGILHIPESIIALTILAAGTSIPDLLSSVIVAKKGKGDMAISNAVGSNIFDILVGLGLVWLIALITTPAKTITVDTHNLMGSVVLLFATIIATVFIYATNKWKVGRKGGFILILAYLGYLIFTINRVL